MSEPATITVDQLRAELDRVQQEEPEGLTTAELAASRGVSLRTAQREIRAVVEAGRWVCAGRVTRFAIDGTRRFIPVYRPVEREEKND